MTGGCPSRQGRAISGALGYAVERINNCSCLLPDVKLEFVYVDTEGKENKTTQAVVDLVSTLSNFFFFVVKEKAK